MEHRIRKGPPCEVGLLLARLTPGERTEVETAMKDVAIKSTQIAAALGTAGLGTIPAQGMRRHRNHECQCPK